MNPAEGEISSAKPEVDSSTAFNAELQSGLTVAMAHFEATPNIPIQRQDQSGDPYVNQAQADQTRHRATPGNSFVRPDQPVPGRDRYFTPDPNAQRRATPFRDGGTQFRRQGDPLPPPDPNQSGPPRDQQFAPRPRQVIPPNQFQSQQEFQDQEFPEQEMAEEYGPGPEQMDPRLTSPDQFRLPGNGIPAYSGMGINFTNNFYNVGDRVPLVTNGQFNVLQRGPEAVPQIRLNNGFPAMQNFFGVPLGADQVLPQTRVQQVGPGVLPVDRVQQLGPGVLPATDDGIPAIRSLRLDGTGHETALLSGPVTDNQARITINPADTQIVARPDLQVANGQIQIQDVAAERTQVVPPLQTASLTGDVIAQQLPLAENVVVAQGPNRVNLDTQLNGPLNSPVYTGTGLITPIEQRTVDRSNSVLSGLRNEAHRVGVLTSGAAYYGLGMIPETNRVGQAIAPWRPTLRYPVSGVFGLSAYEMATLYPASFFNPDVNPNSTWGQGTISAAVLLQSGFRDMQANAIANATRTGSSARFYTGISPRTSAFGIGALTVAGTYALDRALPASRDTVWGTHTIADDAAMFGGIMAARNTEAAATLTSRIAAGATRILPEAITSRLAVPAAVSTRLAPVASTFNSFSPGLRSVLTKGAWVAGAYVAGNAIEGVWNYFVPGTRTLASNARAGLDRDANERTAGSLATARQRFSNLDDAQWSAAQAELTAHKARTDAMTYERDGASNMAVADRRLIVLAGVVGENYLNRGSHVISRGHTYLARGHNLDLNSQAMMNLLIADETAGRLIRKYNENVLGTTINGTTINRATEVAALQQERQRLQTLMSQAIGQHDYAAAMPELVEYAKNNRQDFFRSFVSHNSEVAAQREQDMRNRGFWDHPHYGQWRSVVSKMHRDRAFALLVLAENAANLGDGREAVRMLRGGVHSPGSPDVDNTPNQNARAALIQAINQFNSNPGERTEGERINLERIRAIYTRLDRLIQDRFRDHYPRQNNVPTR